MLLDKNIYNIDNIDEGNCDLNYDLYEHVRNNINIFLNIISKFNKTEKTYILIGSEVLINMYTRANVDKYIKILNLLDISLVTTKLFCIEALHENISILLLFFYIPGTSDYYFGHVIKSIIDRFKVDSIDIDAQIDVLKEESFNGKSGEQIINDKLDEITNTSVKTYIWKHLKWVHSLCYI